MSDQVIIAIIVAVTTIIGSILGAVAVFQANRLKSFELKLANQSEEQKRLAATNTRLADEAKERQAARLAEREADRQDREAKEKEFQFWREAHRDLSKQYIEDHAAYVSLTTRYDEFRREFDVTKLNLTSVSKLSEQQKVEIAHLKEEQDKALNTISSMHDERMAAIRTYEDQISGLNDLSARKQAELQKQIDVLTAELKRAHEDINTLRKKLSEFDSIEMRLAGEIRALERQRDEWQAERQYLMQQIDALKALDGKLDISNAQGKEANRQLSQILHEEDKAAHPDNPVQTDANNAANVASDLAASLPAAPALADGMEVSIVGTLSTPPDAPEKTM